MHTDPLMNPLIHSRFPLFCGFYVQHLHQWLDGDSLNEHREINHGYRGGDEHGLEFNYRRVY